MPTTFDQFLSHFRHVQPHGPNRWTAQCPAHEDRSQDTLSLRAGGDGHRLLYCWAGCRTEDVLQRSGASWADCFEDDRPTLPRRPLTFAEKTRREHRALTRERDRRYGPWRDYWELCDLAREQRQAADRLRAWAATLDPEAESTWKLLGWAAWLDREAEQDEMEADADLEARRAQP